MPKNAPCASCGQPVPKGEGCYMYDEFVCDRCADTDLDYRDFYPPHNED